MLDFQFAENQCEKEATDMGTKKSTQEIQEEIFRIFINYLHESEITLLDSKEYEQVKRNFIERNTKTMIGLPGSIISPEQAYMDAKMKVLNSNTQPEVESGCGLTENFLEAFFLLQHVKYIDTVWEESEKMYDAQRRHLPEENRKILTKIEEMAGNPYADAMIEWAKSQEPILVKEQVHIITKKTPGVPGKQLKFFGTNGGVLGASEPYEVDKSKYVELDVFDNGLKIPEEDNSEQSSILSSGKNWFKKLTKRDTEDDLKDI